MDWKAEAVSKLKSYDAMRRAVCNIPEQIQELDITLYGVQGTDLQKEKVRGSGSRSEKILNALVYREELASNLERANLWLSYTERALNALSPEDRMILQRMYLYPERGASRRLQTELGVEQSTLYRRRDKALERFTIALYGLGN